MKFCAYVLLLTTVAVWIVTATAVTVKLSLKGTSDGFALSGQESLGGRSQRAFLVKPVFAQAASRYWIKTYEGVGNSTVGIQLLPTQDGGFLGVGIIKDAPSPFGDLLLAKFQSDGLIVWKRRYESGVPNPGNPAYQLSVTPSLVRPTPDGGYIVPGSIGGGFSFGGSFGNFGWLLKLRSNGDIEWERRYWLNWGCCWQHENFAAVRPTSDGGYIAVGSTGNSTAAGQIRLAPWVVKLKSDGSLQWQKSLAMGAGFTDYGEGVLPTADGGYIVFGDVDLGENVFMVKLDSTGNKVWEKMYDGGRNDEFSQVEFTPDGGFVMWVASENASGSYDSVIVKMRPDGTIEWQKKISGVSGLSGVANFPGGILVLPSGYIITGTHAQRIVQGVGVEVGFVLMKLRSDGTIVWQKKYGTAVGPFTTVGGLAREIPDGFAGYWGEVNPTAAKARLFKVDANGVLGTSLCPLISTPAFGMTDVSGIVKALPVGVRNPPSLQEDSTALNQKPLVLTENTLCSGTGAPPFLDIGLRVFNQGQIVRIAAEPGQPTSPLRISKNGVIYGIALVPPGDFAGSRVRIKTASSIKELRKLSAVALPPQIDVSPLLLDFGSVTRGQTSSPQTVTVVNKGVGMLSITDVSLTGSNPGQFKIDKDTCKGNSLSQNQSCTIEIKFAPRLRASKGTKNAKLTIASNDSSKPTVDVDLRGDAQ